MLCTARLNSRHCIHAQVRGMARKVEKLHADPRISLMRDVLFRNKTPAKLQFTEEEAIQHDTIHRAWQAHLRVQRDTRQKELEQQYNKMRDACADLAKQDLRLFNAAMLANKVKTVFPIEMRSMTDTPSKRGWNAAWTAKPET